MIGFYVHHHGWGHRARALAIANRLDHQCVGFSTLPRPDGWPGEWVELPPDWDEAGGDPTASGVFHWAPSRHPGHRERFGRITRRLSGDLAAMVVDTSAEVTLLTRLFGVPTVLVALRGDRRDRPHRAAFDAADLILAPWPAIAPEPGWLPQWSGKTCFTGAISRFDGCVASARAMGVGGARRVLVLWGAGGGQVSPGRLRAAAEATPGWRWTLRTPDQPSPDLWRELGDSDVVVTHAGDSAVGEVAAARAAAIVIAEPRPFAEQQATVRALQEVGCCIPLAAWPRNSAWPDLLNRAGEIGGTGWSAWHFGDGAERAAAAIEKLGEPARPGAEERA